MVASVPAVVVADSGAAGRQGSERILSLILPAFNEARRLPASLARCAEFFRSRGLAAEIIVADDGSTDGTAAAYATAVEGLPRAQLRYRYLELDHRGKGAAVRAGVREAAGDPIVFLDSDLTIPVETIDQFIRALADGADIAVASRYVPGSIVDRPWWRVAMGWIYRTAVHAIVPIDVNDTQCGGKMYTAEAAKDLFGRGMLDGFAFDAELLFIARRRGYRVIEIPVVIHQRAETSISFLKDTPAMLRDLVRIRWNGLRGRYR